MLILPPPSLPEPLTWREIYAARAFAGRRMHWDTQFSGDAEKRGHRLGIGTAQLEALDLAGALRPVAFRKTASIGDFADPARDLQFLTFRDEVEPAGWESHAWEPYDGHLHTSANYSPWQLLYVDKALELRNMSVGLDVFECDAERIAEIFERWRPWRDAQDEDWTTLDDRWRPLIKVLVVLQSRFYPVVTGSTPVQLDTSGDEPQEIDVYEAARAEWDSVATAERLELSVDQLHEVFWFLVERGIDHEPHDGLVGERRMALRWQVERWRGPARLAQDYFDAAEVVRQFIIDLTGEPPGRTPYWPMDGRQTERAKLYESGPATRPNRERRVETLRASPTYPHHVHAVVEGDSDEVFLRALAENFVGSDQGLTFTNLRGTGQAKQIAHVLHNVQPMTKRAVVIVDAEGDFPKVTERLRNEGKLAAEDLHLAAGSLEEENATPDELVSIAQSFADEVMVKLTITGEALQERFDSQRERVKKNPKGIAEILLGMVRNPDNGGPVAISKPDFAKRLAYLATDDFVNSTAADRDGVLARRPLLRFFVDRIAPELRR